MTNPFTNKHICSSQGQNPRKRDILVRVLRGTSGTNSVILGSDSVTRDVLSGRKLVVTAMTLAFSLWPVQKTSGPYREEAWNSRRTRYPNPANLLYNRSICAPSHEPSPASRQLSFS